MKSDERQNLFSVVDDVWSIGPILWGGWSIFFVEYIDVFPWVDQWTTKYRKDFKYIFIYTLAVNHWSIGPMVYALQCKTIKI